MYLWSTRRSGIILVGYSNPVFARIKLPLLTLSLALSFLIFFLISCNKTPSKPLELKVGVFLYCTQETQSVCDDPTQNVVEMVKREVESAGGISIGERKATLKVFTEVINNNQEETVGAASRLINQAGVQVLIGPQRSRDAIPVGELARKSGTLMISPMSTSPETTAGRRCVFRIGFMDDFQSEVLARFAIEDLHLSKAAILYNVANPYGRGMSEEFEARFNRLGGEVVASSSYVTGNRDFSQQLALIKSRSPQLLLLPNHSDDVLLQAAQVKSSGISAILLGTDSWRELVLASRPELDGAYKVAHWSESISSDVNRSFVSSYRNLFGTTPNSSMAALTYDAFHILFAAINSAGSVKSDELCDALYALPSFDGVSGAIDYLDTGDPVKSAVILKFLEGEASFIKMIHPQESARESIQTPR